MDLRVLHDKREFCVKVRAACTVVACRVIGDENVYNKFLARQTANNDDMVTALSNGIDFVNGLKQVMNDTVRHLEFVGNERVAQVLRILRDSASCDFGLVNICSICSLTGRMAHGFVVLRTMDYGILVDAKHAKLLHCIWVMWHIIDIETARVEQDSDGYANMSLRSGIDSFLSRSSVKDEELDCYYMAYVYAFTALCEVVESSVCEGDVRANSPTV